MRDNVNNLRDALFREDQDAIDRYSGALLELVETPLHEYCVRLVRSSHRPLGIEARDLLQEAWMRALRYLLTAEGASVQTDEHFIRLLWRIVRQRFLDVRERVCRRGERELDAVVRETGETWGERLASPASPVAQGILWLEGGARGELITSLFQSDAAFYVACQGRPRRRPSQYRAVVLFALAELFLQEILPGCLLERYVSLLGVPEPDWQAVRRVVEQPGVTDEALFAAINARFGTRLQSRSLLSVLRYELNQLVGG